MSGNEDLISVWREIDDAVVADPARRLDVAEVLHPYRHRQTVGWFTQFEEWLARSLPADPRFPDIDDALKGLAARTPLGGSRGGALLALAALARADPTRFGPDGEDRDRVIDALLPLLPPALPRDHAEELHQRGILDGPAAVSLNQGLIMLPSGAGDRDPVPFLVAHLAPIAGHTVPRVQELLDPARWNALSGEVWGPMTPLDHPELCDQERRCFVEKFNVTAQFQLTPVLEFVRRTLPEHPPARALEYRLCTHAAHEPLGDERVKVDAGALVTREVDGWLHVKTTKRIGFDEPFDGPSLVMVAHALGYPEAFEAMVYAALATERRSAA